MHLNSDGAVLFTSALAKDLPGRVISHKTLFSRRQISPLNPLSEVTALLLR
jgi:hypothetical protein